MVSSMMKEKDTDYKTLDREKFGLIIIPARRDFHLAFTKKANSAI